MAAGPVTSDDCVQLSPATPTAHIGYGTKSIFNKFCLPNVDDLPAQFDTEVLDNLVGSFGLDDIQEAYEDVVVAKKSYMYAAATVLFVAVVYNILLRFFAKPIIWISIIGTGIGIVLLSIVLQEYHARNYGENSTKSEKQGNAIQYSVYALYGIAGVYFLTILCLYKSIAVSVAVLQTASVIIIRNIRVLIIPFIAAIFIFAYIGSWLVGFGYLLSNAHIE